MADDDKTETEETTKTGDKTDPWEKMAGFIDSAVERSMAKWREGQDKQSSDKTETETEAPKKPERRKGFLENLFQGLD